MREFKIHKKLNTYIRNGDVIEYCIFEMFSSGTKRFTAKIRIGDVNKKCVFVCIFVDLKMAEKTIKDLAETCWKYLSSCWSTLYLLPGTCFPYPDVNFDNRRFKILKLVISCFSYSHLWTLDSVR